MEDFNYLTTINAVYNDANMSALCGGLNRFYTLMVYVNDKGYMQIFYNKCETLLAEPTIETGEIIKEFCGPVELTFIRENLIKNEKLIKKLIFSKFLDWYKEPFNFKIIY